jgi:hypothetical protein
MNEAVVSAGGESDRPYPSRAGHLPDDFAEVTPAWLTGLLARRYPGLVVHEMEVVEVVSSHTTKVRLRLDCNEVAAAAGIPEHVCLKSNWSGMRTGDICEREARFYHLALGALGALDGPVPGSYFADWDADGGGRGLVVMEDLTESGGAFGHSADHLGVDGVAAGLESLAVLHGALWASPQLRQMAWLPRSMDTPLDDDMVLQFWNYIRLNLANPEYRAVIPQWVYDTPELMVHQLDELAAYERARTAPTGLVHGDAHQGNSFLRDGGDRVWLDWQLARQGSPWRDVSYFVVGGLTVDERRGADRDLVEHHRQLLVATGAEGVPDRDEAWQEFIRWPAYGTQAWLGNYNPWGHQSGLEMVGRTFTALDDYDTVALLTAGKRPRRTVTLGEGAYRLTRELQDQLDALEAG